MSESIKSKISKIYKSEFGRILATMVRILGNYDLAEEATQVAFKVALEKWPREGIPGNPTSWLISTGRFKAIDWIRREKRGRELLVQKYSSHKGYDQPQVFEKHVVEDDQLRLIFYCCHPDIPLDSRIALCLRDFCGMTAKEVSRAYLVSNEAIKKRISRAKKLFREKHSV